jgi:hypothetical protein
MQLAGYAFHWEREHTRSNFSLTEGKEVSSDATSGKQNLFWLWVNSKLRSGMYWAGRLILRWISGLHKLTEPKVAWMYCIYDRSKEGFILTVSTSGACNIHFRKASKCLRGPSISDKRGIRSFFCWWSMALVCWLPAAAQWGLKRSCWTPGCWERNLHNVPAVSCPLMNKVWMPGQVNWFRMDDHCHVER